MIPEMNDTLRENRSSFGINSFALVFLTRLIAFQSSVIFEKHAVAKSDHSSRMAMRK